MGKNYRKTKSGKFQVSIRQQDKSIYRTFDQEIEAKQFVIDMQKSIKHLTAHPEDRSLKNVILTYLVHSNTKELKSWSSINSRVNVLLRDHTDLIDLTIANITVTDLENFKEKLKAKNLKANSVRQYFSILNQAYKYAITRMKMHITNIVGLIKLPKIANERTRVLSIAEYEKLIKFLPDWLEPPVTFAYYSAARQGEILKMKFEDIDFENRVVMLLDTKNGTDRKVPLSKRAFEVLENQKKLLEAKNEYSLDKNVFPNTKNSVSHGFKTYTKNADIKNCTFHDLRHSAITLFLLPKVHNMLTLQKITGHKSLEQLKRYYNPDMNDVVKLLG